MKKILLTSVALAFALGLSSSAFASPPDNPTRPGKVQCPETTNGTPGAFISAGAQALKAGGYTPGSWVSDLAKTEGGVGAAVQGGLVGCLVGSDQPE